MLHYHVKWTSIELFRNLCIKVKNKVQYVGADAQGNAIFDDRRIAPVLQFEGTVKLHGVNTSVVLAPDDVMWSQSREIKLNSATQDCFGFNGFVSKNRLAFLTILQAARAKMLSAGHSNKKVTVFGEWCGSGIQKRVALSQLNKMFVIFGMVASEDADDAMENNESNIYFSKQEMMDCVEQCRSVVGNSFAIKSIYDFPVYKVDIDFRAPQEANDALTLMVEEVEQECPVSKVLGISGTGEGIVFRCVTDGWEDTRFWFKIKGEKHKGSARQARVHSEIDQERLVNVQILAESLVNEERLEQMVQKTFDIGNGGMVVVQKLGVFIKHMLTDINKEDSDQIQASGLDVKELNAAIAAICVRFIKEYKLE